MEISLSNNHALHKRNSSSMLSYPSVFTVTWSQCSLVKGTKKVTVQYHFFRYLQQEADTRVVPLCSFAEILEHLKVILISHFDVAFGI